MARARESHSITTEEVRNVMVDMSGLLDSLETLTSPPAIQAPAGLTISNAQINAAEATINGSQVAIGQAVSFTVTPSLAGSYTIEIVCSTSSGQTVEGRITLIVKTTLLT